MAKIVIQHDEDPALGIVLSQEGCTNGTWWRGVCTECGVVTYVSALDEPPFHTAQNHVDTHKSRL